MSIAFASLLDDDCWTPMSLDQQKNPSYLWEDGRALSDAPVDFAATFAQNMFVTTAPIRLGTFNRNPLRVVPNFVVPRHLHNIDETVVILQGEYSVEFGTESDTEVIRVTAGSFFTSRAGTPYTMTAGPEGVTYIETWGVPVQKLKTVWFDRGWVHR
jgi:mannose-6-phosphate isomerase-like protein (cupin superfamily)